MNAGYGSHRDYMEPIKGLAKKRRQDVEFALTNAFNRFLESREVNVIVFSSMKAEDLANGIFKYPLVLKPLLSICNLAARALERDLGMKNVDTYNPRLTLEQASVIAGYIKPFLPPFAELPTLSMIDSVYFRDKEIRKNKGRWEKDVISALKKHGSNQFKKRMFTSDGELFELDVAYPSEGNIEIGVDVKRIEARRDIHKRCDEIVNKASKLKSVYQNARFAAVVYYPFVDEHSNVRHRLQSDMVDAVVFASGLEGSISSAVKMLLDTLHFCPDNDRDSLF